MSSTSHDRGPHPLDSTGYTGIHWTAAAVCWNTGDGQSYRGIVSLAEGSLTSWQHLPGQQPNMTLDEWHECDHMLREHPAVIEALARQPADRTSFWRKPWGFFDRNPALDVPPVSHDPSHG